MANHLGDEGDNKGVWGRSSNYRENTKKGIKAKPDRQKVYDDEAVLQITLSNVSPRPENGKTIASGSSQHVARYKLDKFTDGSSPYLNHAHHLIPANAFINQFTSQQQNVLRKIKYDVNNGNNLIFLPATLEATRYHLLPWHQTDDYHRKYSKKVKDSAIEIEKKINEFLSDKTKCETEDPPQDIADEMVQYENQLWDLVIGLGPKSINAISVPTSNQAGGLK